MNPLLFKSEDDLMLTIERAYDKSFRVADLRNYICEKQMELRKEFETHIYNEKFYLLGQFAQLEILLKYKQNEQQKNMLLSQMEHLKEEETQFQQRVFTELERKLQYLIESRIREKMGEKAMERPGEKFMDRKDKKDTDRASERLHDKKADKDYTRSDRSSDKYENYREKDDPSNRKKKKSGKSLPTEATEILTQWFLDHCEYPYPEQKQKDDLVRSTGLSDAQVSNWFVNRRGRIWKGIVTEMQRNSVPLTKQNILKKLKPLME